MRGAEGLLCVRILGQVTASMGGLEMKLGPPKQRAVLALLALRAGDPVAVDELADALWGEHLPASATGLVHTYVARLRRALEPDMPQGRRVNVIWSARGRYQLTVPDEHVDLQMFRKLSRQAAALRATGKWESALQLLDRAMRTWRDPVLRDLTTLLPDHPAIGPLRQELTGVGLEYVTLALDHGRAGLVLPVAERLALSEPFNEVVQARCVQALARTGQRAAALVRYTEVCARLRAELRISPGPQLRAAHREALRATADPGPGALPVAAGPARRSWRGPVVDDLVGREEDLRHLLHLLDRCRLVTLTGPAGAGKSALAFALADAVRDEYPGGVTVVELAATSGRAELVEAVSEAVRVPGVPADGRAGRALDLVQHRLLLVLDNAELLVEECAELVDHLLGAAPGISVVVTSREALGLAYETVHRVRPLAAGNDSVTDAAWLTDLPAVRLYARRAAQTSER